MSRNRVIYQSEALYVSKNINSTGIGDHAQLRRVQSANYNFSIERQDVNQFGQLARIDALVLKSPTVSLDFTYYPTDGYNEKALGFYVQNLLETPLYGTGTGTGPVATGTVTGYVAIEPGSAVEANFASGQMAGSSGQNFYIVTSEEGSDINTLKGVNSLGGKASIGIGNGYLSNYTFNASVGNLPTASITIEGLNVKSSIISGTLSGLEGAGKIATGNFVFSPTINPILGNEISITGSLPSPIEATGTQYVSALRPGDITLSFGDYTSVGAAGAPLSILEGGDGLQIQSASISLPLSRTPIERLGSRFAFARVVDFPVVATLNVSAILNEVQAKSLAGMLDDNTKREISLTIGKPNSTEKALVFKFKGSQLQSESFSSSIGANKTVDLVFQTQVGGPTDTANGIYLSGSYTDPFSGNWGY